MRNMDFTEAMPILTQRLERGGVFLTVGGENPNTMTIGWAFFGPAWRKRLFRAMGRPQRHTFGLMEKAEEFTVSIPTTHPLKAELAFAGSCSGREFDQFQGHGLTAAPAQVVSAPIVAECGVHLECRIVNKQMLLGKDMEPAVRERCYPMEDYHMLYFGEVVACYTMDE